MQLRLSVCVCGSPCLKGGDMNPGGGWMSGMIPVLADPQLLGRPLVSAEGGTRSQSWADCAHTSVGLGPGWLEWRSRQLPQSCSTPLAIVLRMIGPYMLVSRVQWLSTTDERYGSHWTHTSVSQFCCGHYNCLNSWQKPQQNLAKNVTGYQAPATTYNKGGSCATSIKEVAVTNCSVPFHGVLAGSSWFTLQLF